MRVRMVINKPPYSVPSMNEIAEVKGTNGYRVISTFSGCGGSCLGFEIAGFDIACACEFVEAAAEVYELNHPGVPVVRDDIREVDPAEILKTVGVEAGEIDVLEGSPPCASFSTSGKGSKGWGEIKPYSDTEQRVDDLFFEFARLINGIRPKVFVAENVAGLVRGVAKGYFKDILAALRACGYRVEARLLNAQWLGVPQSRNRLIFMGIRDDLRASHVWPTPLPYRYSIKEACPWISNGSVLKNLSEGFAASKGQIESWYEFLVSAGHPEVCDDNEVSFIDIRRYAVGREWLKLQPGEASDKYFNLVRSDARKPLNTVTASGGFPGIAGVAHPSEPRKFTIPELRRLCSFPDDFQLVGSFDKRWERLGRSVPPLMMRAIAEKVRGVLDQCAV